MPRQVLEQLSRTDADDRTAPGSGHHKIICMLRTQGGGEMVPNLKATHSGGSYYSAQVNELLWNRSLGLTITQFGFII